MEKANVDLNKIEIKSVEVPVGFITALFEYFDKLDRPYTEKEPYMTTFRESYRVAQYKEYLRLEAEKAEKEELLKQKEEKVPEPKE